MSFSVVQILYIAYDRQLDGAAVSAVTSLLLVQTS